MYCCTDGTQAPSERTCCGPWIKIITARESIWRNPIAATPNPENESKSAWIFGCVSRAIPSPNSGELLNRPNTKAEDESNRESETNRRSGGVLARPANLSTSRDREAMSPVPVAAKSLFSLF
jgi:hypothetical protein